MSAFFKILRERVGKVPPPLPDHLFVQNWLAINFKDQSALIEIELVIHVALNRSEIKLHLVISRDGNVVRRRHGGGRIVDQIQLFTFHLSRLPDLSSRDGLGHGAIRPLGHRFFRHDFDRGLEA